MATSAREIATLLGGALNSTEQLEVLEVNVSARKGVAEVRARLIDEAQWHNTLRELLTVVSGYRLHVGIKYELSDDDRLTRGWYISVAADNIASAVKRFRSQLLRARARAADEDTPPRDIRPVKAGLNAKQARPVVKTTTPERKRKPVSRQAPVPKQALKEGQLPDGGSFKEVQLAWKTHPEARTPTSAGARLQPTAPR